MRWSRSQSRRGSSDNDDDESKALFRHEREQSLSIIRDARSFMEIIGDGAGGGDGPTAGCLRSRSTGETMRQRTVAGGETPCAERRPPPSPTMSGGPARKTQRDGMGGGGVVGGMKAERAAVAQSHEREIEEWRGSNDELSRQVYALMKDNKQLIQELEEANTLVVSSVRNEIKQEQLSKKDLE